VARLTLTPVVPKGSYPTLPITADSADVVFNVAGTYTDGEGWANTGREVLMVQNSGASPYTVTITSVAYLGRVGDITTYSLAAGEFAIFGPFDPKGWNQADGQVYVAGSNALVKFAVIQLPSTLFQTT
jgi:hypothetical protein